MIVEVSDKVENGNGVSVSEDEFSEPYIFNVAAITVQEYVEFDKARLANNYDVQLEIMEKYLVQKPEDADSKYFKVFLKMREAFGQAMALNKVEASGYSFEVDKITIVDATLFSKAAATKNVEKLSEVLLRYLARKPKGVDDLSLIPYGIFDSLISKFTDAVLDLGKN